MKNSNSFADFSKIVSKDNLRPAIQYAIVEKGRLIATDTHCLAISDLANYVKPEQMPFLNNKVFDGDLLKKLSKAKNLIFFENHIIAQGKNGVEKFHYSGRIDDHRRVEKFDHITGEFSVVGIYPNWPAVIPGFNKETFKIDFSNYKLTPAAYNAKLIGKIAEALNHENLMILSKGFNMPAIVLKKLEFNFDFSEFSLLMPISNSFDAINDYIKPLNDQNDNTEVLEQKVAELMAQIETLKAEQAPKAAEIVAGDQKQDEPQKPAKNALKNRFKNRLKKAA